MIIKEIIRLAFSSLAANILRSILTICGIAIGVFSIIAVMTIIGAMSSFIEKTLTQLGSNSFQIQKFPAINFSNPWERFRNRRDITYPMAERFKELMGDTARVNMQLGRRGLVAIYKDRRTNPSMRLVGTDENYMTAFDYAIAYGRNLSAADVALGRPVCVIGEDVRAKLFPNEDAIGALIRVGSQNYTVIGVATPKGATMGESRDVFVLMPISRYLMVYGRANRSIGMNVQALDQASFGTVQDRAIGMMRLARGLAPEDPNDFEVFSNDSLIETSKNITDKIALGALAISAIALIAAGVGVMNIMLVSVTERTKEIGVRKSIGAKKVNILMQFLLEAVVLSMVGGFGGILLGAFFGNVVITFMSGNANFPWLWVFLATMVCGISGAIFGIRTALKTSSHGALKVIGFFILGGVAGNMSGALLSNAIIMVVGGSVSFPWDWAFLAMFVCGLIGVGFGLYPAWKASSLDPIEALRYE